MNVTLQALTSTALDKVQADLLVVLVHPKTPATALGAALRKVVDDAIQQKDFELKPGRQLYLHRPAGMSSARVLLVAGKDASPKALAQSLGKAMAAAKELGVKHLAVAAPEDALSERHAYALAVALGQGVYVYRHTKPSAPEPRALRRVSVVCSGGDEAPVREGLRLGQAVAQGVELAKEWGNRPGNHCTPRDLAQAAKDMARRLPVRVQVFDEPQIKKIGMGAFLGVTRGSAEPPRFIVLQYQGAPKTQAPVVLVGKGITFDTGGISLKPAPEMDEMKFDMCGAASVLGTFEAVATLKPRINLVGLIPTCENMPGGKATKPGDVVTTLSGQTVEVLNTDAEGRLILCDALTYAERFKPAAVVDIATLTGACVIALGHQHSGLFSPDDGLARELLDSGEQSLDTAWRMPLDDEYEEALKSNFADMGNVGGRAGGAITAAKFLHKFAREYPWAHLDIAGTAWKSGAAKGATGRPVGLLTHFVLARAQDGAQAAASGSTRSRARRKR